MIRFPTQAAWTAPLLALASVAGCITEDSLSPGIPAESEGLAEDLAPVPEVPEDWATRVGEVGSAGLPGAPRKVIDTPAALTDERYANDRPERVRRLVYRVSFLVPPSFRHRRRAIRPVAGELHVDVAAERLRARFVGPGWPIHDGAEVRLREDVPGVYVFDGDGGRWLSPGQMATWFEGHGSARSRSSVRIRREFGKLDGDEPAALICSLLAEWTNQPREALEPRCRGGSLPPGFRFGPWRAEVTAVVPLQLPRHSLRADEKEPPPPIAAATGSAILAATERAQLDPRRARHDLPLAALEMRNETAGRLIVLAQGLPVAWLDAGSALTLEGLVPGHYRVGAIRPFGILHRAPQPQPVPGTLVLGRGKRIVSTGTALPPEPPPKDGAQSPGSPSPGPSGPSVMPAADAR